MALSDEPTLVEDLYVLPRDPLGPDVLVPAFRQSTSVMGAFGWFSSSWIARLAPGLAAYLNRDGVEPIAFTIAPVVFDHDWEDINRGVRDPANVLLQRVVDAFDAGRVTESALAKHAVECLAWLLADGRLSLKVARPFQGSTYHPKMWVFKDGLGNVATVRGSGNVTGPGIHANVENMDVDTSWPDGPGRRLTKTVREVEALWQGTSDLVSEVQSLPQALAQGLLRHRPASKPTEDDYLEAADKDGADWARHRPRAVAAVAPSPQTSDFHIPDTLVWEEGEYAHQGEAVHAWEVAGRRGVIEMATGAGKTITALIAACRAYRNLGGPLLIVISAPSNLLVAQWVDEVRLFGLEAAAPTLARSTMLKRRSIQTELSALRTHRSNVRVLVVTNDLLNDEGFRGLVRALDCRKLLIGDEAHTLGTETFFSPPPSFFDMRMALSATPVRQYDDEGTARLMAFFGDVVYRFGLEEAIGFCLVHYDYFVHVAYLSGTALEEFRELTAAIGRKVGMGADDDDESLTKLRVQRRAILESAPDKVRVVEEVLRRERFSDIDHTLIYTTSKNPEQMQQVNAMLDSIGLKYRKVTEEETARPQDLAGILATFREGATQLLVAKRVLDEGLNIPEIHTGHLLASSTVEREWVQRRGRMLRMASDKSHAVIHDYLALPPVEEVRKDRSLVKLISWELERVREFGRLSRNNGAPGSAADVSRRISETYFV